LEKNYRNFIKARQVGDVILPSFSLKLDSCVFFCCDWGQKKQLTN